MNNTNLTGNYGYSKGFNAGIFTISIVTWIITLILLFAIVFPDFVLNMIPSEEEEGSFLTIMQSLLQWMTDHTVITIIIFIPLLGLSIYQLYFVIIGNKTKIRTTLHNLYIERKWFKLKKIPYSEITHIKNFANRSMILHYNQEGKQKKARISQWLANSKNLDKNIYENVSSKLLKQLKNQMENQGLVFTSSIVNLIYKIVIILSGILLILIVNLYTPFILTIKSIITIVLVAILFYLIYHILANFKRITLTSHNLHIKRLLSSKSIAWENIVSIKMGRAYKSGKNAYLSTKRGTLFIPAGIENNRFLISLIYYKLKEMGEIEPVEELRKIKNQKKKWDKWKITGILGFVFVIGISIYFLVTSIYVVIYTGHIDKVGIEKEAIITEKNFLPTTWLYFFKTDKPFFELTFSITPEIPPPEDDTTEENEIDQQEQEAIEQQSSTSPQQVQEDKEEEDKTTEEDKPQAATSQIREQVINPASNPPSNTPQQSANQENGNLNTADMEDQQPQYRQLVFTGYRPVSMEMYFEKSIGAPLTIKYLEENPQDFVLAEGDQAIYNILFTLIGSILIIGFALLLFIKLLITPT